MHAYQSHAPCLLTTPAGYGAMAYPDAYGGTDNTNRLEVTKDGINFEVLAEYPNPDVGFVDSGCLVILDDKNLLLAGGFSIDIYTSARAYIYNKDTNEFREVGNMTKPKWGHSCGLVQADTESGYEVIIVGGFPDESVLGVEIFSIETETFRPGKCAQCKVCKQHFHEMPIFAGNELTFEIRAGE